MSVILVPCHLDEYLPDLAMPLPPSVEVVTLIEPSRCRRCAGQRAVLVDGRALDPVRTAPGSGRGGRGRARRTALSGQRWPERNCRTRRGQAGVGRQPVAAFSIGCTRFALLVEAAIRPQLQRKLSETAAEIRTRSTEWMRAVGSENPLRDISFVANQVDALTLHQLVYPNPDFDPEPSLTALVTALVGTGSPAATPPHRAKATRRSSDR